jgi:hypothetical protein
MLDRVEMDVMRVLRDIPLVTQSVFPKTRLPQGLNTHATTQSMHQALLDEHPAGRKISVIGRQAPDAMQVIGHDHHRQIFKRSLTADVPHHMTQSRERPRLLKPRLTLVGHHSEKISPARHVGSTVLHGCLLPDFLKSLSHGLIGSSSIHFPIAHAISLPVGRRFSSDQQW